MSLLCRIGLHRWVFKDVRDGDYIVTWCWCRRGCWKYHAARQANIDFAPLGPSDNRGSIQANP